MSRLRKSGHSELFTSLEEYLATALSTELQKRALLLQNVLLGHTERRRCVHGTTLKNKGASEQNEAALGCGKEPHLRRVLLLISVRSK